MILRDCLLFAAINRRYLSSSYCCSIVISRYFALFRCYFAPCLFILLLFYIILVVFWAILPLFCAIWARRNYLDPFLGTKHAKTSDAETHELHATHRAVWKHTTPCCHGFVLKHTVVKNIDMHMQRQTQICNLLYSCYVRWRLRFDANLKTAND